MGAEVWRPAHLTAAQMEERRLAAAVLLRQGRLTQAAIARRVGVSRASVCRWAATLARAGRGGLRARPRSGRPGRLGAAAWTRLGRLLDRGATAAGFDTAQWTLRRIAALIWREFGVRYHPRYLERPLRAYGFTVQPPASRPKERDEHAVAAWPKRTWRAIKKEGLPRGAHHPLSRRDRP
jgi:putative transposase